MVVRVVKRVETIIHNEGVETMKMSEEGCNNKCRKKPARDVPEGARESMADFAREQV